MITHLMKKFHVLNLDFFVPETNHLFVIKKKNNVITYYNIKTNITFICHFALYCFI